MKLKECRICNIDFYPTIGLNGDIHVCENCLSEYDYDLDLLPDYHNYYDGNNDNDIHDDYSEESYP